MPGLFEIVRQLPIAAGVLLTYNRRTGTVHAWTPGVDPDIGLGVENRLTFADSDDKAWLGLGKEGEFLQLVDRLASHFRLDTNLYKDAGEELTYQLR